MSWTHLEDRQSVSRKARRCYLCGQQIEPGTRYVRRIGANSGVLTRAIANKDWRLAARSADLLAFACGRMEAERTGFEPGAASHTDTEAAP